MRKEAFIGCDFFFLNGGTGPEPHGFPATPGIDPNAVQSGDSANLLLP